MLNTLLTIRLKWLGIFFFIYMHTTEVMAHMYAKVPVKFSTRTMRRVSTPGPEAEICASRLDMTLFLLKVMGNGAF